MRGAPNPTTRGGFYPRKDQGIGAGDRLCDRERLGEGEVSHWARRSRISLSRSVSARTRWMKSVSLRTRSISARIDSTTSELALMPRARDHLGLLGEFVG